MNRKRGFTLVELVMVIIILGILAAVAIPTFFNLQEDARRAACRSALGGMRSGISIWYASTAAWGTATWPTIVQLTATQNGVMANGIIPQNPYTQDEEVIPGVQEAIDDTVGWIYDQATGRIWSSATQTQGSGF